jgi:hypothetical protein
MPSTTLSHPRPNDIPRDILAFRTITTILARIQQERPFKISLTDSEILPAQQKELKISNALANLAVANHDVVAVATVQSPEELNVVACPRSDSVDQSPPSPSPNASSRFWNLSDWKLIFSRNPRNDDDELKDLPVVRDAEALITKALAGLDGDETKLRAYVESRR